MMNKESIKYNFNLPSLSENLREVIDCKITNIYKFLSINELKYLSGFREFSYIFQENFVTDDVGYLVVVFSNNIVLIFCEDEEQNSIIVCYGREEPIFDCPIFTDTFFQYKISIQDMEVSFLKEILNKKVINIEICSTKNLKKGILHRANETAVCFNIEGNNKLLIGFAINDEPKRIFEPQCYNSLKVIKSL